MVTVPVPFRLVPFGSVWGGFPWQPGGNGAAHERRTRLQLNVVGTDYLAGVVVDIHLVVSPTVPNMRDHLPHDSAVFHDRSGTRKK